jgi:hypothetical protein
MNLRMLIAYFVLCSGMFASDVRFSLRLERDTILPFEPLYVRIVAANKGSSPASVQDVSMLNLTSAFGFVAHSVDGRSYQLGAPRLTQDPVPKISKHLVAPGESLASYLNEISTTCLWQLERNVAPLPVGTYVLQARGALSWEVGNNTASDTLPTVAITVRQPDSTEAVGSSLYGEIESRFWMPPWLVDTNSHESHALDNLGSWERTGELASDIGRRCPKEPYVVLAAIWGFRAATALSEGGRTSVVAPDSLGNVFKRLAVAYPNSPAAAFWLFPALRQSSKVERAAFLQKLRDEYPEQAVGRQARFLLAAPDRVWGLR